MKMISFALILFLSGCNNNVLQSSGSLVAVGQMPAVARDNNNMLHLVYGCGDSLMYAFSSDQGYTFSSPTLISVVPKLAASHTRGPQIATTSRGLVLTACNDSGNIYSFVKEKSLNWIKSTRVNDQDTVAKENLMALGADGNSAFAVWLDLRDKHNKIFGSQSIDGGKTWAKNIMIYASPDTTVCECCRPSVLVKGNKVYVMFRNWLDGNRDLYLIQSVNGGASFGEAQKLGNGSWPLKGCPMDGGGIALNAKEEVQTVWNRKGKIYSAVPGQAEKNLGEGRSCTVESVHGKNVYAWVENGEVVVRKPMGSKKILGKGQQPVLKALNNEHVICIWENDKQIYKEVIEL